jgi:nucleoside-diphosphate-sugar epimerase
MSASLMVSGASGFIGREFCAELIRRKYSVKTIVRDESKIKDLSYLNFKVADIGSETNWIAALQDIDVVVHLAARVHVMNDKALDPLESFRKVNTAGTFNLARQAAAAGVKRFVFVSTIKVNGEVTMPGRPFRADDVPVPLDPYAVSKLEAEQSLRELEAQTGMEVVVVRPPLVYGPGVKANFAAVMRWLARGFPLPLGAIHNARSMVALDNLVDLLVICLNHPAAAGQTFLVSDGEDVSTTELMRRIANAMGKKALLLPVPASVLELGATMMGKRDVAQRLCGSLQVDFEKTRRMLGWNPPLTLDQGLKKAVEGMKP